MKTIQAVARYFPDKCGGIQAHLSEILPGLQSQGVESKIAASTQSHQEDTYIYKNIEVYRYPVFPKPPEEPNHGHFRHGGFEFFAHWLEKQQADIYHQHQWNFTCGLPHLRLAKKLGFKTIVTIHLAQAICQRRTMLLNGTEICNGKIERVRCSSCCDDLTSKLPNVAIKTISHLPISWLSRMPLPQSVYAPTSIARTKGTFIRPLAIPAYVAARQRSLLAMAQFADKIIAVSDWLYQALLINGVPADKLVLCRCGIADSWQQTELKSLPQNSPLKVGYLGRWNQMKGIDILVKAIARLPPKIPIQLDIHAISEDQQYYQSLSKIVAREPRISILPTLPREKLASALTHFDLLAVPSQCLETGPLVVLEAHACGTPVIGSNLGGIAELVNHGVDGWLVEANNIEAWTNAFTKFAQEPDFLQKLRQGIQPVRNITTQAAELINIYQHSLTK